MSVFLFTAPPPDLSTTVVGIISTSHAFSSDVGKHSELLKSIFRAILLYNLVMNTIVSLVIGEYYRPRSKFDQHPCKCAAGRIWWISTRVQAILGKNFVQTHATVIAMMRVYGAFPECCTLLISGVSPQPRIWHCLSGSHRNMLDQFVCQRIPPSDDVFRREYYTSYYDCRT